jgi:hypothetical protein
MQFLPGTIFIVDICIEKMYLLYIFPFPWAPHTYDFVVLNSLTHPRNILLVVLQTGKSQRLFITPKYVTENISYVQTRQLRHNFPTTNLFGWRLQSPFRHAQHVQLGAPSPSNFEFGKLIWLYGDVKEATNYAWTSRHPQKHHRIASARQNNTAL